MAGRRRHERDIERKFGEANWSEPSRPKGKKRRITEAEASANRRIEPMKTPNEFNVKCAKGTKRTHAHIVTGIMHMANNKIKAMNSHYGPCAFESAELAHPIKNKCEDKTKVIYSYQTSSMRVDVMIDKTEFTNQEWADIINTILFGHVEPWRG
jgi:hypothetical protein